MWRMPKALRWAALTPLLCAIAVSAQVRPAFEVASVKRNIDRAGGTAAEPVDASGKSWCLAPIDHSRPGVEILRFAGAVMQLMQRVQPYVDRPVVDATGLSGNVEWVLTFGSGSNAPADVPGVFTALPDQLGLKLETRQAAVEVLVVDHVELPTPD
jgi:uncharacterized protein (TIGR03435 family)